MKKRALAILLAALISLAFGCERRENRTTAENGQSGQAPPSAPYDEQESSSLAVNEQASPEPSKEEQSTQTTPPPEKPRPETLEGQMENTIQATITMEDGGVIVIELYPDLAPQSVRNFVYLARDGFYDGLKFHRIMKGFMIQGGCPLGTGTGNPGYSIAGEFTENGFENDLKHTRGVLSMARANDPDSAGSQFFIVHGDAQFLDGKYAAFGQVISGMDVVDRIAETPNIGTNGEVADKDKPVIKSITIDDDIELPEPIKLDR